jgi:hypothetical protein
MEADRKEFLKNIGLGSLALGSLPALLGMLTTPARAQGGLNFHFVTVTGAGAAANQHIMASFGQGHFDPKAGSRADGRGGFFHFRPAANPPFPLVGSGTWEARRLVSYKELGKYGIAASGIAELVVDISQQVPSPAVMRGAVLKVVCNIGAAGLVNPGEIEGVTWTIPGTEFEAGGTLGPFRPIPSPPPAGSWGLTVFTTVPTT